MFFLSLFNTFKLKKGLLFCSANLGVLPVGFILCAFCYLLASSLTAFNMFVGFLPYCLLLPVGFILCAFCYPLASSSSRSRDRPRRARLRADGRVPIFTKAKFVISISQPYSFYYLNLITLYISNPNLITLYLSNPNLITLYLSNRLFTIGFTNLQAYKTQLKISKI